MGSFSWPQSAVLYAMSPDGTYPPREVVGIPDFADDFRFSTEQVAELFDCDPDSGPNADVLSVAQLGPAEAGPATTSTGKVLGPARTLGGCPVRRGTSTAVLG